MTYVSARAWLCLIGAAPVAGCSCSEDAPAVSRPIEAASREEPTEPEATAASDDSAYGRALVQITEGITVAERGAERHPNSWIRVEQVAGRYAQRAKLTGSFDDYLRADEALTRAFAMADRGSGPLLTRAHLHFTLHRLDRAEADLATLESGAIVQAATRTQIAALRGDIAFHRGQLAEAERLHRESDAEHESAASAFRIAYDLWQRAQFDEAERWLSIAEARVLPSDPQTRAWMNLQKGLIDLDRGRYADALAHYQRADQLFSGWWLVHEHIAEVQAALGNHEEAERMYRDVVERTESPELMDALADLLEERGNAAEARTFRTRARERFERQLEQLPEAAYGHALEHFLAHGTPERALELAEANHRLRPGGEATVRLTQALVRAGRLEDARARIEPLLETPYRTAEMHATAALVLRRSGETTRADEQARLATEIHPQAIEDLDWLTPPG